MLATLYIVYLGVLWFISYEMHLVELRCIKGASLSKATTVIISSAHIASRTNNYNINYDLDFIDFRISLVVNPSIKREWHNTFGNIVYMWLGNPGEIVN